MVAAQHAHLRAAAGAGALDGGAGLVEDVHVADRPRGGAVGAAHPRAARADRREVVADAAAAAHGLGRLAERDVDAGLAVDGLGDRIAHRLHEAVDQRDVADPRARRRVDPPAGDEAVLERLQEHGLPGAAGSASTAASARATRRRTARAIVRAVEVALGALGVLLAQDVEAHLLPGQVGGLHGAEVPGIGLVHLGAYSVVLEDRRDQRLRQRTPHTTQTPHSQEGGGGDRMRTRQDRERAMEHPRQAEFTADEFLAWALEQPTGRYELDNGVVVAMSPERVNHALAKGQAWLALRTAIAARGLACQALPDGATVRIDDRTVYEPDTLVRCGPPLPGDAIEATDPVVVVEVVSPSSRGIDRASSSRGISRCRASGTT